MASPSFAVIRCAWINDLAAIRCNQMRAWICEWGALSVRRCGRDDDENVCTAHGQLMPYTFALHGPIDSSFSRLAAGESSVTLMAPPCTFIRCFNVDKQGVSSK